MTAAVAVHQALPDRSWLPLGALEHAVFCLRQAVLMLRDGGWADDGATVTGTAAHQRVDDGRSVSLRGARVHHRVALRSDVLRLHGVADAVERTADGELRPVEHKSTGRHLHAARLQALGQAVCLREMTGLPVPEAVVYVRADKQRHVFPVTGDSAGEVARVADRLRGALALRTLPPVSISPAGCRRCSLQLICLPLAQLP